MQTDTAEVPIGLLLKALKAAAEEFVSVRHVIPVTAITPVEVVASLQLGVNEIQIVHGEN